MLRLRFLLAALLFLALGARAQQITGTLTDAGSGQPLPFVNVGVIGKSLGTVSNEQGIYHLSYRPELAADTVRISSLGYRSRRLLLRELLAQPNLSLAPEAVSLGEAQVQATNPLRHQRTLGYDKAGSATYHFESQDLGAEIGTRIQLHSQPTLLRTLSFLITENKVGAISFRVNLYRLDRRGQPTNEKLLGRDVIVTAQGAGPLTVDLTADKLLLDEDFFLALEWVKGGSAEKVKSGLVLAGGIGYADNDVYVRGASQDEWERISVGALLLGMQPKLSFSAAVRD